MTGSKEIVSARFTVLNGVTAPLLGAQVQGTFMNLADDTSFSPAVIPNARLGGMRETSGVLAQHAYLDRFPTTPTNRNRHRVSETMKRFAATYPAADVPAARGRTVQSYGNG